MSTVHKARPVSARILEELQAIDSCTVCNAIERLDIRLRNEGFTDPSVRCLSGCSTPMVGFAATGRIRTSAAPTTRHWYYDNLEWWEHVATVPAPRVIVLQDVDERPALGALFGEIHAHIARALGCVGYLTNGVVRDLPGIESTGFHLFACGVSVSHAYAHVVDFGGRIEVGGLAVQSGDLLHGDMHGVVSVPNDVAAQIPAIAARLQAQEQELIALCRSDDFSLERLRTVIERARHGSR